MGKYTSAMRVQLLGINLREVVRFVLVAGLVAAYADPLEGATQWGIEGRLDEFGEVLKFAVSEPVGPMVPQRSPYEELKAELVLSCNDDVGAVMVQFSQVVKFSGSEHIADAWKNEAVVRVDGKDAGRWDIGHVNEPSAFVFVGRHLDKDERFELVMRQLDAVYGGKTAEQVAEDLVGFGKPQILIQKMISGSTFAVSIRSEEAGRIAFSWSTKGKEFRGLVREVCPASQRWQR